MCVGFALGSASEGATKRKKVSKGSMCAVTLNGEFWHKIVDEFF